MEGGGVLLETEQHFEGLSYLIFFYVWMVGGGHFVLIKVVSIINLCKTYYLGQNKHLYQLPPNINCLLPKIITSKSRDL